MCQHGSFLEKHVYLETSNKKKQSRVKTHNLQVGRSPCGFLIRFTTFPSSNHDTSPRFIFPARLNLACPTFMSCHLLVVVTSGSCHPPMATVALPLVRLWFSHCKVSLASVESILKCIDSKSSPCGRKSIWSCCVACWKKDYYRLQRTFLHSHFASLYRICLTPAIMSNPTLPRHSTPSLSEPCLCKHCIFRVAWATDEETSRRSKPCFDMSDWCNGCNKERSPTSPAKHHFVTGIIDPLA